MAVQTAVSCGLPEAGQVAGAGSVGGEGVPEGGRAQACLAESAGVLVEEVARLIVGVGLAADPVCGQRGQRAHVGGGVAGVGAFPASDGGQRGHPLGRVGPLTVGDLSIGSGRKQVGGQR